jgi:hypothetical protein
MRFVGLVMAGDSVAAEVAIEEDGSATFAVVNATANRTAVVGNARRAADT